MIVSNRSEITILALDDELDVLDQLATILGAAGYNCRCCQSAVAAVQSMRELAPHLIIADINLSGKSGLAVCEKLTHEAGLDNVPVMFLSAAQVPDIIRRTHGACGTYYLRKPFDGAVLLELVNRTTAALHLSGA
jgi:DNA-binding response OmpR family regulator